MINQSLDLRVGFTGSRDHSKIMAKIDFCNDAQVKICRVLRNLNETCFFCFLRPKPIKPYNFKCKLLVMLARKIVQTTQKVANSSFRVANSCYVLYTFVKIRN